MKSDYQQMEVGGDENIKSRKIMNNNQSNKAQNNISLLMKSRIQIDIPPTEFLKNFKWIIVYMLVMIIIICIFMKYYIMLGFVNLCLAILGFMFIMHGILKKLLITYRMGTAFWILEFITVLIEVTIYLLISFGQIFSGRINFFTGLLKFIGLTIILAIFLLVSAFYTYHIMKKKSNFLNNVQTNLNLTQKDISFSKPIQTPGTISSEKK